MSEQSSAKLSSAVIDGLKHALVRFEHPPTKAEAHYALVSALTEIVATEARKLVEANIQLEVGDGMATVALGAPVALLLRDLLGEVNRFCDIRWTFEVEIPGWEKPEPTEIKTKIEIPIGTRQHIDPRSNRPTRGTPL